MTATRKLSYDDVWQFKEMGNIALSPDGRRVAFVMQSKDKAKDTRQNAIWLLHLDEHGHAIGTARQLTSGSKNDLNPTWAPDSLHLLFISNREEEKKQLWVINTDGGEARKLTNMLHGVNDAAWSPDGQWIALVASAFPTDDDDLLVGRKTLEGADKKKYEDAERFHERTINKIWYRLDGRGLFERFDQLFVMPAPSSDDITLDPAAIRRLTSGDYDHGLPCWLPNSQEISVLCNRNEDRDGSMVTDLWLINHETGDARCITDGTLQIASYAWSPDGQRVILIADQDMRKGDVCNERLYLVGREGGKIKALADEIDNNAFPPTVSNFGLPGPYRPQWSRDGKYVYFLVNERGSANVYCLDVAQNAPARLTNDDYLTTHLSLFPNEQGVLLAQSRLLHPWEIYLLPLKGEDDEAPASVEMERLTHLHDRQLEQFAWSIPERITYAGANGDEIDGWIVRPIGAREGVRYPLLVSIHGGPHSTFTTGMSPFFQCLAAQGFASFYCNPHGSSGRGQDFMRQVVGDWGGWDFQDIMLGVDACIARGIADPARLVVTGYSYGGYMTMYVIGQTDRFKAAVPMAGISNLASFVGTSDIGFWMVKEAQGYPWDPEREAYYRERSPLTYAARVTTPTCIIHPENDLRCPIEQSEQFYMALKMMGKVPVEFVRGPASWHMNTTKQSQFYGRWQTMLEWFLKYVEIRPEEYD
ncbi:MAG TPA: S9 family peptidase [Ktedonobacteraceae bacterium]|jgi:dipeptidyl aminopeptidase/acylaminoacyl peptidase|nr:S9 family peptidase [Ktedonobacteraceae bacterium]